MTQINPILRRKIGFSITPEYPVTAVNLWFIIRKHER